VPDNWKRYPWSVVLDSSVTSHKNKYWSCICLTFWSRLWQSILPTSNCFWHEASNLDCHRLYNRYLLTPLLYSAHLCCCADSRGQGKVCWSGSVLGSRGLPTSYQLILSKRNPATTLTRRL